MGDVHFGVHGPLEKAADEIIFGSMRGVTSHEEKRDILTPWKWLDRWSKEVMARSGTVDPAIRRGMYNRVANTSKPYLNSREGIASAYSSMNGATPDIDFITDEWGE